MGYDQLLLALARSRTLPVPGLAEHAVGFKDSPTRSTCATTGRDARGSERTEDPARREKLLTYVFVGGGYGRARGARRAPGFARRRVDAYPAPPARDALGAGRRRAAGCCRRSTSSWPITPCAELRGRGIDIRRDDAGGGQRDTRALERRGAADRNGRLTAGVARKPILKGAQPAARRARPGARRPVPAGRGMDSVWAIGGLRWPPRPARRHLPATAPARRPPGRVAARNIAAELGIGSPEPFVFTSYARSSTWRYKAVADRQRTFRGFPAWWLARQLPHEPDPGTAQGPRRPRLDHRSAVPPRTSELGRSAIRNGWASYGTTVIVVCMPFSSCSGRLHRACIRPAAARLCGVLTAGCVSSSPAPVAVPTGSS